MWDQILFPCILMKLKENAPFLTLNFQTYPLIRPDSLHLGGA